MLFEYGQKEASASMEHVAHAAAVAISTQCIADVVCLGPFRRGLLQCCAAILKAFNRDQSRLDAIGRAPRVCIVPYFALISNDAALDLWQDCGLHCYHAPNFGNGEVVDAPRPTMCFSALNLPPNTSSKSIQAV